MKKTLTLALAVTVCILSSCGSMGTGTQTNNAATAAGSTVGANVLNSLIAGKTGTTANSTTSSLANVGTGVIGGLLTTLLGNTTSVNTICGTWVYTQPKVTFESENVLAQIGSSVASSKIESTLQSQLTKIGFTAGKTVMTFKKDGTCSMTIGGKTTTGTYTYADGKMTIKGAMGLTSMSPYVSVMGNQLYMVFDADKLMGLITGITSKTSSTSTLSTLLKSYTGLKLGWQMQRQ